MLDLRILPNRECDLQYFDRHFNLGYRHHSGTPRATFIPPKGGSIRGLWHGRLRHSRRSTQSDLLPRTLPYLLRLY